MQLNQRLKPTNGLGKPLRFECNLWKLWRVAEDFSPHALEIAVIPLSRFLHADRVSTYIVPRQTTTLRSWKHQRRRFKRLPRVYVVFMPSGGGKVSILDIGPRTPSNYLHREVIIVAPSLQREEDAKHSLLLIFFCFCS